MKRMYKTGASVLAALLIIPVIFLCVGDWGASMGASLARNWLQGLSTKITFDALRGNLLRGYRLSGLKIADSLGNEVMSLPELSVSLASFDITPFTIGVNASARGLRLRESHLESLLKDLKQDFSPKDELDREPLSRPLVMPRQLNLVDFASSEQPWALEALKMTPRDEADHYDLLLEGSWNQLPLVVQGMVAADVTNPSVDLIVAALEGTSTVKGSLSQGVEAQVEALSLKALAQAIPELASFEPDGLVSLQLQTRPEAESWDVEGTLALTGLAALGSHWGSITMPFRFAQQEVSIQGLEGSLFGARLSGDGSFHLASQNLKALFELSKVKLAGLPAQYVPSGVGAGLESLLVDLAGPLTALTGKAQWKGGYANWSGLSLSGLTGSVELQDGNFDGQATGTALKGPFSVKARGGVQEDSAVTALVDWKKAQLAGLASLLPQSKIGGLLSLNLKAEGTMANPTAQLNLTGQNLSAWNVAMSSLQTKARATRDQILLEQLTAKVLGGSLSASGSVTSWLGGKPDGKAQLRLSGLDVKALKKAFPAVPLTQLSSQNNSQVSLRLVKGVAQADLSVSVPSATVASIPTEGFTMKSQWKGTELHLKESSVKVLGGLAHLSGILRPGHNDEEMNLKGSLEKINLSKVAPSGISGMVKGSVSLRGTFAEPVLDLSVSSDAIVYSRLVLSDLLLRVAGKGSYNVELKAQGPKGPLLSGGGSVALPQGDSPGAMKLQFNMTDLDVRALMPSQAHLGGLLSATLSATGTPASPELSFRVWSDELTASALAFQRPEVTGRLRGQKVDLLASLGLGDTRPQAKALLTLADPWKLEFRADGTKVDLHSIVPDQKDLLQGRLNWQASGKIDPSGIYADGRIFSDRITVSKLNLTGLSLPFRVRGADLTMDDGKAVFVEAPLALKAQGNLVSQVYTATLDLTDLDLNKVSTPYEIPGTVTGTVELHARGEARLSTTTLAEVTGAIRAHNVEVAGVPYMKMLTSGAPLKIQKALISFTALPDEVIIMPGSTISSWPDDTVFRYVALSGPVWRQLPESKPEIPQELLKELQDQLRLSLNGNINIKALNSVIGGLGVLVQSGVAGNTDPRELAGDFISGLLGSAKDQFRDVSFVVCGTYEKPSICDLEVENKISFKEPDSWTDGGGRLSNQKGDPKSYKLQFSIPVGPGIGRGKSVGEQATGQVLKQIINSLLSADQ